MGVEAWLGSLVLLGPSAAQVHAAAWVAGLGWLGQLFFSGRVLVQWLASERARRPVAPRLFWWLSGGGAILLVVYSSLRGEIVLVPGYVVTLLVYLRNLWIASHPTTAPISPVHLVAAGLLIAVGPYAFGMLDDGGRAGPEFLWLSVAILGQAFWIGRFLVQWRHAEKSRRSEFPPVFWWLTIAGSGLLLAYTLHRGDLPLIFGFLTSWAVPMRNLMLHHRQAKLSH